MTNMRSPFFLSLGLVAMSAATAQESPDVAALLAASIEAGESQSRPAWGQYAFRRHILRQKLDERDTVKWKQEMLFQVTPTAEGFDEELLQMDGRPATAAEVKKHRKAGKFESHYEKTREVVLENPLGSDLALLPLLYDQEHEYVGLEEVDGIPCHRIRWQAREETGSLPWQERLKYAMKGSLCVETDGSNLIHADMATTRMVKNGPIKVSLVRIVFETRSVGGVWLPSKFEMVAHVTLPGKKFRTHNIYRYSDYRRP